MTTRTDPEAPARERRWVAIAEDGRHVTLGRDRDPDDEEIIRVEEGLRMNDLRGWLVIAEGDYWSKGPMSFLVVRPMNAPTASFDAGRAAFLMLRGKAVEAAS